MEFTRNTASLEARLLSLENKVTLLTTKCSNLSQENINLQKALKNSSLSNSALPTSRPSSPVPITTCSTPSASPDTIPHQSQVVLFTSFADVVKGDKPTSLKPFPLVLSPNPFRALENLEAPETDAAPTSPKPAKAKAILETVMLKGFRATLERFSSGRML